MTSPIWVGDPAGPPLVDPPPASAPTEKSESQEPDRREPLSPTRGGGYEPLPVVPPQRARPAAVAKLRATWFRAAARRHRSVRVRLRWKAAEGPFDVQARRAGSKRWTKIATRTGKTQRVVRLTRGKWVLRVRAVPPFAPAGPWRSLTVRL
jgi:hypothetical protein